MSSKRRTAAGFSIFESTAARPSTSSRASATSSGRWTKESASQSTPSAQTNSRSARSLSESAARGSSTSGTLTPLRLETVPLVITVQSAKSAPQSSTRRRTLPSSTRSRAPGSSAAKISGCGRRTRAASPSASSRSRRKRAPSASSTAPSAKVPTRSFGPWRSARMPIGRSSSFSTCRMIRWRAAISSWVPWLMLRRNTSAPASCSARMRSWSLEDGPSVATILTLRRRLMGLPSDGPGRPRRAHHGHFPSPRNWPMEWPREVTRK